jgi:hypothetical protein
VERVAGRVVKDRLRLGLRVRHVKVEEICGNRSFSVFICVLRLRGKTREGLKARKDQYTITPMAQ